MQDIKDAKAQSLAEASALSSPGASTSSGTLQPNRLDDATAKAQGKAENSEPLRRTPAPSSSFLDEEPEEDLEDTTKPWASERVLDEYIAEADRVAANMTPLGYATSESSQIVAKHVLDTADIEGAEYRRKSREMSQIYQDKWPWLFPKSSTGIASPSFRTVGGRVSKGSPPRRKVPPYYPSLGRAYTPVGFSQTQRSASSSSTTSRLNGGGLTPPDLGTDATISDDELTESDLPPPFTSSTPVPDEDASTGEEVAAGRFKVLPNPDDFLLALTNPASRSTSALSTIAANTQEALKLWQDQYLELDARLARKDPDYKPKSNPRELEDATTFEAKKAAFFAGRKYKDTSYFHDSTARARNKKLSDARKQRERELEEAAIALSNSSDGVGGRRLRLRKPRRLFDTGLNETDTAASRATSVLSTRKRKRDGLDDAEDEAAGTPSASTSPVRKRGRPAAATKKPLLPSLLGRRSGMRGPPPTTKSNTPGGTASPTPPLPKRKGRPPKAKPASGGPAGGRKPVVKDADGKNPTRRVAMAKVWATRRENGTSGRHGGPPLSKTKKGRIGRPRKGEGKKDKGEEVEEEDEKGEEDGGEAEEDDEEDTQGYLFCEMQGGNGRLIGRCELTRSCGRRRLAVLMDEIARSMLLER